MNPEDVPELIAKIGMADPRVKRTDPIERRAQLEMWIGILVEVPRDFALHAAQAHYAESQWAITAGDIATRWQAVVKDRMRRDNGTFEPTDHPGLHPDDVIGYLQALRGERQAVALGYKQPSPVKAITAGAAATEAERRIAALGDYLTTEVREQLDRFRPMAAERVRIIRSGQPDPLAVACPYEHCRADPGKPCRNARRVPRKSPHPSRLEGTQGAGRADAPRQAGTWPQGGTEARHGAA